MRRILSASACVLAFLSTSGASYAWASNWETVGRSSDLYGTYAQEATASVPATISEETKSSFSEAAEEKEEEESSKFLSGSVVGVWKNGFGRGANATQLDQVWLTSERMIDTETRRVDVGYRVDALFGVNNAQCYGDGGFDGKWGVSNDGYGASIYQVYGEIGVGKLSLKVGKFGCLVGYEPTDLSESDFNTLSHMCLHEPAAHSGGLFSYRATDKFSVNFGLSSGPDRSFENRFGDSGFLFGAAWQATDDLSIGYASELNQIHSALGEDRAGTSFGYYSDLGGVSVGDSDEYLQSVTVDWSLSEKLSYAFTTNYGSMSDRAEHRARYGVFGFANYLTYDLTDKLTSALRFEYYMERLEESGRPLDVKADELKCYEVTYGLIYRPSEHIFVRPEVRYDWTKLAEESNGFTGSVGFGATF